MQIQSFRIEIPQQTLGDLRERFRETRCPDQEGAYAMRQGTKPQTIALGLNDSPAGMAAWVVKKFRSWSVAGISRRWNFRNF